MNLFSSAKLTVHLSNTVLTNAQTSLLDQSLNFIPTVCRVPYKFILGCKKRIIRNLKLRD